MCVVLIGILLFSNTVLASGTGDVAGAIDGTWSDASGQIKLVFTLTAPAYIWTILGM